MHKQFTKLILVAATLLLAPLKGWSNAITLHNDTPYAAYYVVSKGQQIIARIPGLLPGQTISVPTDNTYTVLATTIIDGNTYTSVPMQFQGAAGFLAQIKQNYAQGTYEFSVIQTPPTQANTLTFQKTTLAPVTFTILKDRRPLQNIVVENSFEIKSLNIDETFYVYAVVNGVTTDILTTRNSNAVITAMQDTTEFQEGWFYLVEQ